MEGERKASRDRVEDQVSLFDATPVFANKVEPSAQAYGSNFTPLVGFYFSSFLMNQASTSEVTPVFTNKVEAGYFWSLLQGVLFGGGRLWTFSQFN